MLFTLAQVIVVLEIIGSVPEAQLDQRATMVIAFGQQTMYRHGKLIVQLFVDVGMGLWREIFWHEKRPS